MLSEMEIPGASVGVLGDATTFLCWSLLCRGEWVGRMEVSVREIGVDRVSEVGRREEVLLL